MTGYEFIHRCLRLPVDGVPKAVLLVLAIMANDRRKCWPSINTIATRAGWSRRAVIDAIAELELLGVVVAERHHGRSTVYRVHPEAMAQAQAEPGKDDEAEPIGAADPCSNRTSAPAAPVQEAHPHQCTSCTYPCTSCTLSANNCQLNRNTPQPPQAGASAVDGFAQFIDAYPRREAVEQARRQWRRLRPDDGLQASILTALALQRQSAAWQREGGRYVPLPSKWLRARRWTDSSQAERQRAARPAGWQDDPAQVKAVGASIGQPYSLAALGNGYTDDERIAHYRRYRAQIVAAVQAEEQST